MGPSRGTQRYRLFGALLIVLAFAAPATARGAPPRAVGPGPVTGFEVRGNTVAITAARAQAQVIFSTDDLFRIWTAPLEGKFSDPANSPPERDGAPAANVVAKHDYPGVTPRMTDEGAYRVLTTRALALRVYTGHL